jgi:hypothetical protein
VIGALALELARQLSDLQFQVVDQPQADVDGATPRIGDLEAVEQLAAGVPEPIRDRHGWPKVISVAWMRFLSVVRCRTRCNRKRASSRSHRIAGSGSQIAGTKSRCESTATRARRSCRSCTPAAPAP